MEGTIHSVTFPMPCHMAGLVFQKDNPVGHYKEGGVECCSFCKDVLMKTPEGWKHPPYQADMRVKITKIPSGNS